MMYDCEISDLRKISIADSSVVDPASYNITLSNDYMWVISARTQGFSGVVNLAPGTVSPEELIAAFGENGINIPLIGVSQTRVAVDGTALIGLVGPNDAVIKPNWGKQRI